MLVLSRKTDEVVVIGEDIEVMVVELRGDRVRLGITAPRDVRVHRKEIWLQIQKQNTSQAVDRRELDDGNDETGDDRG